MPAKTISAHIAEVLKQIEEVQPLDAAQRVRATNEMYYVFKMMQGGASFFAPLYPDANLAVPIFESYRQNLKASDILDDPPGLFRYQE